jgi:hypothetical protein
MDTSPTSGQTIRLLLDINRTPEGRLEGQIRTDDADAGRPFSGVLELLKLIDETYIYRIESDVRNVAKEAANHEHQDGSRPAGEEASPQAISS